jgi:carboxylesterase type B
MGKPSRPYCVDLQFCGHIEGLTYLDENLEPLCHLFGGVPYALPPLRFQKPKPLPTCYQYGTKVNPAQFTGGCGLCPQPGFGEKFDASGWDEDCLQSNVWVPVGPPPPEGIHATVGFIVMLTIQGGRSFSGSMAASSNLVRQTTWIFVPFLASRLASVLLSHQRTASTFLDFLSIILVSGTSV